MACDEWPVSEEFEAPHEAARCAFHQLLTGLLESKLHESQLSNPPILPDRIMEVGNSTNTFSLSEAVYGLLASTDGC